MGRDGVENTLPRRKANTPKRCSYDKATTTTGKPHMWLHMRVSRKQFPTLLSDTEEPEPQAQEDAGQGTCYREQRSL